MESLNGSWYILSAEHGLLDPEKVIPPYEKTLNRMGVDDRRNWGDTVLASLQKVISPGDRIVFLAGERYREFLEDALTEAGVQVEVPMQGLTIGRQLQWLKAAMDEK